MLIFLLCIKGKLFFQKQFYVKKKGNTQTILISNDFNLADTNH